MINLSDYQAFFSDIDGTLLDRKSKLHERTINAMRQLPMPLYLISGRSEKAMRGIQKELGAEDTLITLNGNAIMQNGKLLYQGPSLEGDILDEYDATPPYYPYNNRYSSLLTSIIEGYTNEYKARYFELRKSVLSYSSIIDEFEKYIAIYGEDIYIQDTINFPAIPSVPVNTLNSLRTFVKDRFNYLDDVFGQVI